MQRLKVQRFTVQGWRTMQMGNCSSPESAPVLLRGGIGIDLQGDFQQLGLARFLDLDAFDA